MINLKTYFEVVNYRISEGSEFLWDCFGQHPYSISAWSGSNYEGWSVTITFDLLNQTVFMVETCDYRNERAYRLINPGFKDAYMRRGTDKERNQAWDYVEYIDLETDEDWIEKTTAIVNGKEYDTRVSVPLDLSKDEMFELMTLAHEKDITLNDLVKNILTQKIAESSIKN